MAGMVEALLTWGLFARGLAAVQAFALLDLSRQVLAFGGSRGIVPAHVTLTKLRNQLDCPRQRWRYCPSLLWITGASDAALRGISLVGVCFGVAGFLGLGGLSPLWCLLANVCLLSLDCVFGLAMPWDCLLLELGWLGALLPPTLTLPSVESAAPPHPAVAWMCRWLLWRLIFGFGKLKFSGTDHEKDRMYLLRTTLLCVSVSEFVSASLPLCLSASLPLCLSASLPLCLSLPLSLSLSLALSVTLE
eukprot:COSAG03_NODE_1334_length_4305_cov_10.555873_1_plen_246_part_10